MANPDFTPLFKTTVGFDRIPNLLRTAEKVDSAGKTHPPYNIEKLGENDFRVVFALAGYSPDDIDIVQEGNRLIVSGERPEDENVQILHRGIDHGKFRRELALAEFVDVERADFDNGVLTIELRRNLPESMKPRQIEITPATAGAKRQEPKKAA